MNNANKIPVRLFPEAASGKRADEDFPEPVWLMPYPSP